MASDRDRVIIAEAISKCWSDSGFKARFTNDPAAELNAAGMDLAAGTTVQVFESTNTVTYLTLSHDIPLEQYGVQLGKAIAAKMPLNPGSEIRLVGSTPSYLPICLPTPPAASGSEMSDADLLAIAGGDYSTTSTNTVQTAEAQTTAVQTAEAATTAAAAAEAVAVAVAAVVV